MSPHFWARLWIICASLLLISNVVLAERSANDDSAPEYSPDAKPTLYLNQWGVEVRGGAERARRVAEEAGFVYLSQVGSLDDFHTFAHPNHPEVHHEHAAEKTAVLHGHSDVHWAEQQKILKRSKRSALETHSSHAHRRAPIRRRNIPLSVNATRPGEPYQDPHDPMWDRMWYHHRRFQDPRPVWRRGFTGRGVVISILDDGVDYTHPDLKDRYDAEGSYDYNSNDNDPMPHPTRGDDNRHGTRCAGEVSAQMNDICVVGAAYNSSIGGVRMLDGDVTDTVEGNSLSFHPQHIDIYSSSWGPDDDGFTVDGPARLAQAAFKNGAEKGRGGLGSIFVWASGNGGSKGDSCGCDGYTNTIYSISVSAMSQYGNSPWYSEHCASTLASTYSSGSSSEEKIVTVDLHHSCTPSHTGTSAAAPMAAGLLALVLEANPNLTWRDMQHLVVLTSQPHPPDVRNYVAGDWTRNAIGLEHSHEFGFGLMHTAGLVNLARHWRHAPEMRTCLERPHNIDENRAGTFKVTASACRGTANEVRHAENVVAIITVGGSRRGSMKFGLTSPQGTPSNLLPYRSRDKHASGFDNWRFLTVRSWGEDPHGEWVFQVSALAPVQVMTIQLEIHGTLEPPMLKKLPRMAACHAQCFDGCIGLGSRDCHSCRELTVFSADGAFDCVPQGGCPPGFVKRDATCRTCNITDCWRCSDDRLTCLECSPGLHLTANSCSPPVPCPEGKIYSYELDYCVACSDGCKRCDSPTRCLACATGRRLWNDSCVEHCPPDVSVQQGGSLCARCAPSCRGCGPSSTVCTGCPAARLLLPNGTCIAECPVGAADDGMGRCVPCPPSCSVCLPDQSCVACHSSLFMAQDHSCVALCPPGSRANDESRRCEPCKADGCKSCVTSASVCSECTEGLLLSSATRCSAECPAGSVADAGGKFCQPCAVAGCVKCASDFHACDACSPSTYHLPAFSGGGGVSCVAACPGGYFAHDASNHCMQCNDDCLTCRGRDACSSCQGGLLLDGGVCVTACPRSTFPKAGRCQACDPSCSECRGPNILDCTACSASGSLIDSQTGACRRGCRPGLFSNDTHCIPCRLPCAECNQSAQHCTACPAGKSLHTSRCLEHCPSGFATSKSGECERCEQGCTECAQGQVLVDGRCVDGCPDVGFASDGAACTRCSDAQSCRLCPLTADQCVECQMPRRLLSAGRCVATCPAGEFAHGRNICSTCHVSCATCISDGDDRCVTCHSGSVLQSGACVASCSDGFFALTVTAGDESSAVCAPCNARCRSCDSASHCRVCHAGFALTEALSCVESCGGDEHLDAATQRCIRCRASRCQSCDVTGVCERCALSTLLHQQQCVERCPDGFFAEAGRCRKCRADCAQCAEFGSCQSCVSGLFLHAGGQCRASCPDGQYVSTGADGGAGECRPCHGMCATCTGPGKQQCVRCSAAALPDGWFRLADDDGGGCARCHASCRTCTTSATKCSSCHDQHRLLSSGGCVPPCPPSQFYDPRRTACVACTENCVQCTPPTAAAGGGSGGAGDDFGECVMCSAGFRKAPVDGLCYPCCDTGRVTSTQAPCCGCGNATATSAQLCVSPTQSPSSSSLSNTGHHRQQGLGATPSRTPTGDAPPASSPASGSKLRIVAGVVAGLITVVSLFYLVTLVHRRYCLTTSPIQYSQLAADDAEEIDV